MLGNLCVRTWAFIDIINYFHQFVFKMLINIFQYDLDEQKQIDKPISYLWNNFPRLNKATSDLSSN